MERTLIAWLTAVILGVGAGAAHSQVAFGPALNVAPNTAEGCEFAVLPPLRSPLTVPPSCTLMGISFSGQWQPNPTPGQWTLTRANVRTGPRTGPMRFVILRYRRSQAQVPGQPPAGIICCDSPAQSQVFTPPPNQIVSVPVNLPMSNTVELVGNEPIEIVDRLAISLLDLNSSLPAVIGPATNASGTIFAPAMPRGPIQLPGPPYAGFPLISGTACPRAGGTLFETGGARELQQVACAPIGPAPGPVPGPSPSPAPPPASSGRAQAGIASSLAQVGVRGNGPRVAIPLACGAGTGRCGGTVAARSVLRLPRGARNARPVAVRARSFSIAAGRNGAATLVLPALARRELGARGVLALRVTTRPAGGTASTKRIVLRSLPVRARAARNGRVRALVDMPPEAVASRRAQVQLRLGRSIVARGTVATRPGRVLPAVARLTPAARQRLARSGRLRLALRVTYRDAAGAAVVRARPLVVLAPR